MCPPMLRKTVLFITAGVAKQFPARVVFGKAICTDVQSTVQIFQEGLVVVVANKKKSRLRRMPGRPQRPEWPPKNRQAGTVELIRDDSLNRVQGQKTQ